MTEKEFRTKLDELGRSYSACINNMNAMHDRNLHEGWRRRAQGYLDEIAELEHRYRSQQGAPDSQDDNIEVWQQRLANKLAEGAHPDVIRYCEDQIAKLSSSGPSQGTPTSGPAPRTWLEHHDALVKEWFDGERALVGDLYPNPPKRAEDPVFGPLARGVAQTAKILGLVAAVFAFFIGLAYAVAWVF